MKWTLRKRIALPFIIVLLTSIGSVGSISLYLANQTLSGLLDAQLEAQSRTARQAIDDAMSRLRSSLVELSADADTRLALGEGGIALEARERLIARLEILDDTNAEGERFSLLAVDGAMVASSLVDDGDAVAFANDAAFQEALSGSPAFSAPFFDSNQRPVVVLFVPVQDDATTRGVLAAMVQLASLTARILDPIKVLDTGYAYLCDATGLVIGHPDKAQILKTQIANYDWGREILRTSEGQIRYTYAGVSKLAVFSACESLGWRVTVTAPDDEIYAPARRIGAAILATGLTVILIGMGLAWLTARWIGGVLADLTRRLAAGASETSSAAAHVSESSQSLSQGASEEAAALQQTSATLEELSATIRQNTADTQKAKELAKGANASAAQGSQNVRDMEAALRRIDAAGTAIAKIIKSIDEIAFQTNLLALNAAVEAARAGEAGAGFAIVADEVRSLAQRSAQAAKETAELVEHVVKSTGEGVADGAKVARSLTEIHANVQRLDGLVIQVATASAEQDRGISQLHQGVAQLEKVTQNNAATAEESAASAEELNSQAATLRQMVEELETLVGATERQRAHPPAAAQSWDAPPSNLTTRASTGANGGRPLAGVSRKKYAVAETSSLR